MRGPRAEATLLRAWLAQRAWRASCHRSRTQPTWGALEGAEVALRHPESPTPSDLLSAELDRFARDRIYEEAVAGAA